MFTTYNDIQIKEIKNQLKQCAFARSIESRYIENGIILCLFFSRSLCARIRDKLYAKEIYFIYNKLFILLNNKKTNQILLI